jgi:hypothetical protein
MIPALASAAYHFMGADDGRWLPLQQWIVGAGFIGAVAFLLRRRVPAHVLLPALALLLYAPAFGVRFTSVLADQQVAYLLALAGVTGALWLVEGPRRWLVPAALFLGAASLAKTEGLLLGGLLALGLCAVALASRPRRLEPLVLVGAVAAAILPWKLWLAANDQPLSSQLYSWSKLVHPRYLADRLDRLGFASRTMAGFLFAESKWLLVLPLVLLAVVLAARLRPGLALLVVAWLGVGFVGLAAVYWISPLEIHYYVDTSAERVASTLAIFAGTLLPLLVAEATRRE